MGQQLGAGGPQRRVGQQPVQQFGFELLGGDTQFELAPGGLDELAGSGGGEGLGDSRSQIVDRGPDRRESPQDRQLATEPELGTGGGQLFELGEDRLALVDPGHGDGGVGVEDVDGQLADRAGEGVTMPGFEHGGPVDLFELGTQFGRRGAKFPDRDQPQFLQLAGGVGERGAQQLGGGLFGLDQQFQPGELAGTGLIGLPRLSGGGQGRG